MTSRKYGGTGLGLTISKRLASLLGGDITVVSELGKGSEFRLTIAAGPLDHVPLLAESRCRRPTRLTPMNRRSVSLAESLSQRIASTFRICSCWYSGRRALRRRSRKMGGKPSR